MVDEFRGATRQGRTRQALGGDRGKNAGPTEQENGTQGKSGETNEPTSLKRAATSDFRLYRAPKFERRRQGQSQKVPILKY